MVIESVGVVGTGQMGLGIARHLAAHSVPVTLIRGRPGPLDEVRRKLGDDAERVSLAEDPKRLEACDLVIESVAEDRNAKAEWFSRLNEVVKPEAIFATNTSTLDAWEIEMAVRLPYRPGLRAGRFIGLHFFNPVAKMSLVEVAIMPDTRQDVRHAALDFLRRIDKEPVVLRSFPGQIVNNLLMPMFVKALALTGIAEITAFDKAMKLGANHPMGPFELMDFIGLDVVAAMAINLGYGHLPVLERMVKRGCIGRKAGLGFYDYRQDKKHPRVNAELRDLLDPDWRKNA